MSVQTAETGGSCRIVDLGKVQRKDLDGLPAGLPARRSLPKPPAGRVVFLRRLPLSVFQRGAHPGRPGARHRLCRRRTVRGRGRRIARRPNADDIVELHRTKWTHPVRNILSLQRIRRERLAGARTQPGRSPVLRISFIEVPISYGTTTLARGCRRGGADPAGRTGGINRGRIDLGLKAVEIGRPSQLGAGPGRHRRHRAADRPGPASAPTLPTVRRRLAAHPGGFQAEAVAYADAAGVAYAALGVEGMMLNMSSCSSPMLPRSTGRAAMRRASVPSACRSRSTMPSTARDS